MPRLDLMNIALTLGLLAGSAAASVSIPASAMPIAAGTCSGNGIVLRGALTHTAPIRSSAAVGTATLTLRSGMLGIAAAQRAPECPGDINGDGSTDAADFTILASNFGTGGNTPYTNGDLNGDEQVNAADFGILAGSYGCGS